MMTELEWRGDSSYFGSRVALGKRNVQSSANADAMGDVLLMVVKGNLRHRIEKLGIEKSESQLTEGQHRLREIARLQKFGSCPPERPDWGRGAFFYLTPHHAAKIQDVTKAKEIELASKHVLVSREYRMILKGVLEAAPAGSGREAFLTRRAGVIETETVIKIELPNCPEGRETQALPCVDPDCDGQRRGVYLLQLGEELMQQRGVDLEVLEFLTAPISVQELQL